MKSVIYTKHALAIAITSALSTSMAYAQGQQNTPEEQQIEVIEVTTQFQRNLTSALNEKRSSSSIIDGISADDITTLPALDLGEALQAVPGVQLDREGERRESSISLRGLPGGLVKTTANGQTVANPTRSNNIFGAPSPFGAYDAAVFDGIKVIKTTTAKDQEGAIAGVVDLGLPNAFGRKSGSGSIAVGIRREELAGENDKELKANGTYHLIEDVLAITGKLAYSDQNFRRDTIRTNRYDNLGSNRYRRNVWLEEAGATGGHDTGQDTYAEWTAQNGIADGETVYVPSELRQGSEINGGSRYSFSGNLGYRPTSNLSLGATVLLTENKMDDNRYEQTELRMRNYSEVSLTPVSAPIDTGLTNANGRIWSVPDVQFHDTRYFYDNRQYNFLRASEAFIFDAEWNGDTVSIDGAITISGAENEWDEILISPRAERAVRADGTRGTDVYGQWNHGSGDVGNYQVDVFGFDEAIDFDGTTSPDNQWIWGFRPSVTSSGAIPEAGNSRGVLLLTGTYENLKTDHNAFEVNFEKVFDNSSVILEAGFRWSEDKTNSNRQRVSGAGIDLRGGDIWTNAGKIASEANDDFFGGQAPGFADINDGWYSFDFDTINSAMLATLPAAGSLPSGSGETDLRLPNGYVARAGQLNSGLVYETDLETTAAYIQASFDGELGKITYRGNMGFRYVSDKQTSEAPFYRLNSDGLQEIHSFDTGSNEYSYILPSFNIAFELTEDLVLRAAHSESISRPNLRQASPQTRVNFGDGSVVGVTLPGTNLVPFTADNYDLSLEWYNREGSSIALAYFKKEIDGFYRQGDNFGCNLPTSNIDFGNLSLVDGVCISDGNDEFGGDTIAENAEINIVQWFNSSEQITLEGIELAMQQNLNFLPFPWNGLGGAFNYTHVSQSAEEPASGLDPVFIPGVSEDSYNLIAFYEQENWGIRFTYNYRDDYQVQTTNTLFGTGVRTVKAVGRFDMSAYYDISEKVTVSLKGYNLNESVYEEFQDVEALPRRQDFEGRTWVLTAAMKF